MGKKGVILLLCLAGLWLPACAQDPEYVKLMTTKQSDFMRIIGDPDQEIRRLTLEIDQGGLPRPKLARAYLDRGKLYSFKKDMQFRAMSDFNTALELEPQLADAYYFRSVAWERRGEMPSALADLKRFLTLAPDDPDGPRRLKDMENRLGSAAMKKLEADLAASKEALPPADRSALESEREKVKKLEVELAALRARENKPAVQELKAKPESSQAESEKIKELEAQLAKVKELEAQLARQNEIKAQRAAQVSAERRVALVIGNAAYKESPLQNPVNDAEDMARSLNRYGFRVIKLLNATREGMKAAVREFGDQIKQGGVGLFFYAGHGLQVDGENYLVPVNANVQRKFEVGDECLKVSSILGAMEEAGNRLNIIILDACRDNPFRGFRGPGRGLAEMTAPRGSLLAYATAPGSVARDGDGRNGLYTAMLLRFMPTSGLTIEGLLKKVRVAVMEASRNQQVPWDASSLTGEFYFEP
ncbi:MAG: caspase family protein [Thermodesulfobacteriota bacterium]